MARVVRKRSLNRILKQLQDVPGNIASLKYDPVTGAFEALFRNQEQSPAGIVPDRLMGSAGNLPNQEQELKPAIQNAIDLVLFPPQGIDDNPIEVPADEPAQPEAN